MHWLKKPNADHNEIESETGVNAYSVKEHYPIWGEPEIKQPRSGNIPYDSGRDREGIYDSECDVP
jgi:hypothetical protein